MVNFKVKEAEDGMSLEKITKKILNDAPLSFIYKMFRKKDVKVNNHWQDRKYIIHTDDLISIYINDAQLEEFKMKTMSQSSNQIAQWIVYEDKNILIINKPRGILVQKDSTSSLALDDMVNQYLSNNDSLYEFKCGPAHRIDRNTSGIVLFGKTHNSLNYLSSLIKEHTLIEKHYLALVSGQMESNSGEIDVPLKKIQINNHVVVSSIEDGGKNAKTQYRVIKQYKDCALLDLTLLTGRTHQIRVHMAYINHPLIGDSKYGDFKVNKNFKNKYNFENQFLHANEIRFLDVKEPLNYLKFKNFKAKLPEEFEKILKELENSSEEN